jgi:hypothetical protein
MRSVVNIVNTIEKYEHVYIYGAGIVADEVASCILGDPYNIEIEAFIVSKKEGNPDIFHSKPVLIIDELDVKYSENTLFIVACLEKVKSEIIQTIKKYGFNNILNLSFESDNWSIIRSNYIKHYFEKKGLYYLDLDDVLESKKIDKLAEPIDVYRAVSAFDKELNEDISDFDWETKIQVGAALTDRIITKVRDDIGDNISSKNRMYCELTALYWMWKNSDANYLGLCHYRRHFILTDEERRKLPQSDIDVVMTVPIANFPDVRTIYDRDHIIADWEILKKAIKEKYADYYEDVEKLEKGNVYFAYNMFIARREIFNKYCEFLFDVLEYCELHCAEKKDPYQNRYLGFLGERLLSIFMFHHYDEYKIAVADKHFAE